MLAMCALACGVSYALPITIESPSSLKVQQGAQNPCIFSNPSCQQPGGFLATPLDTGGNVGEYDEMSPAYTISDIVNNFNGGNTLFSVGLDINTASPGSAPKLATEVLNLFELVFLDSGDNAIFPLLTQSCCSNAALPLQLSVPANGTGFSDVRILGFDLQPGINAGAVKFKFNMHITEATDGTENAFFIFDESQLAVPEPGTIYLLITGLAGLAFWKRRR